MTVYLDNFKISRLDITFGVKGQVYNFISFLEYILVLYEMQLILNVVDKLILFDISMPLALSLYCKTRMSELLSLTEVQSMSDRI